MSLTPDDMNIITLEAIAFEFVGMASEDLTLLEAGIYRKLADLGLLRLDDDGVVKR
jgi:hypothetical protein